MRCTNCNSESLKNLGMRWSAGRTKNLGYTCNDCGNTFMVPMSEEETPEDENVNDDLAFIRDDEFIDKITSKRKIVFTTAVNNVNVNKKFLNSVHKYCEANDASLVIFPIKYRNPSMLHSSEVAWYDDSIVDYLVENNFEITEKLRALGGLKTQATVENPLSGVDGLSKGSSIIFGHPQVALKTLPRQSEKYPAIATTTGAITEKHYSSTKVGYKAAFNHSMSALVVELDNEDFFIRHLNFDGKGFYDLDHYYDSNGKKKLEKPIEALITGDEHAVFADEDVMKATYYNEDSLVNVFKPKFIVRHDLLDFFSASHHHKHNFFLKFAKHHANGAWSVENELQVTIDHVNKTTPSFSTNVIIASNHNEHLMRWLNEADPKLDPENAILYHFLMYNMLTQTKMGETNVHHPEPFELYAAPRMQCKVKFLSRNETFNIKGVELSNHGDRGASGSRGSPKQFSNIPTKTVTGHVHSPTIDKGNYTLGTSSRFDLSYVSGLSAWDHTHCIIHPNGKRQLVFIRNGKYRAG